MGRSDLPTVGDIYYVSATHLARYPGLLGALAKLLASLSAAVLLAGLATSRALFASQTVLLAWAVSVTPLIGFVVRVRWGAVLTIALEAVLFIAIMAGFTVWLVGTNALGPWVVHAFVLVVLLETGGHLTEEHRWRTLKRLSEEVWFQSWNDVVHQIEQMLAHQAAWFSAVLVGLLGGSLYGLLGGLPVHATLSICIQAILILSSVVLLGFLFYTFVRMCDPLFRTGDAAPPLVVNDRLGGLKGRLAGIVGTILRIVAPREKASKLDLACIASDLRRVYLYDAMHNVILLVACVASLAYHLRLAVDVRLAIVVLLALALLFNQVPFVIGQARLHERVLEAYGGAKRAKRSRELKELVPLFPSDLLTALVATGTAGALLLYLLGQFLKTLFD